MSLFDGLKATLARIESEEEAGVKMVMGIAHQFELAGTDPNKINDAIRELRAEASNLIHSQLIGAAPAPEAGQPVPTAKPAPDPHSDKPPAQTQAGANAGAGQKKT